MSKRKHYQVIRAFADGWRIESSDPNNKWEQITNPMFYEDDYHQYRIVPDAEGWIPFYSQPDSECPVDPQQRVEAQYGGEIWIFAGKAGEIVWKDDGFHNVTRYRPYKIVDENKPKVNLINFTEEKIQLLIECRNSIESVIDGFSSNNAYDSTVNEYKEHCKERLMFILLMEIDKLYTDQKFYGCRKNLLGSGED